jgi:hypothetical protein
VVSGCVGRYSKVLLSSLCTLVICASVANFVLNTMERCSLFLPLQWGAGPMALMLCSAAIWLKYDDDDDDIQVGCAHVLWHADLTMLPSQRW